MTPAVCLPVNWKVLIKKKLHHCVVLQVWVKYIHTDIYIHTTSCMQIYFELQSMNLNLHCSWSFDKGCVSLRKLLKDISFVSGTDLQKFCSSFWNNYFWNVNPLDLTSYFAKKRIYSVCSFCKILKKSTIRQCFPVWGAPHWRDKWNPKLWAKQFAMNLCDVVRCCLWLKIKLRCWFHLQAQSIEWYYS